MKSKVAVVRDKDPSVAVRRVLDLIEAQKLLSSANRVLVKPNYITAQKPSTGVTTDTRIIACLITFLKECGLKDIAVGDGGMGDTEHVFDVVGIREVVEREHIRLIDLNRDERVPVQIPEATALQDVGLAKTILDYDTLINVPKLKIHGFAKVTLGIKNLMGAVLPKSSMHHNLDRKLADLATVLTPRFTIIDGTVGCEKDELYGRPVPMDVIVGGTDIVAVDVVGSLIMGVDPFTVPYLVYAAEKGLGVLHIDDIDVVGDPIRQVRRKFRT